MRLGRLAGRQAHKQAGSVWVTGRSAVGRLVRQAGERGSRHWLNHEIGRCWGGVRVDLLPRRLAHGRSQHKYCRQRGGLGSFGKRVTCCVCTKTECVHQVCPVIPPTVQSAAPKRCCRDSHGFCCDCDVFNFGINAPNRGGLDCAAVSAQKSAHCLRFNESWWFYVRVTLLGMGAVPACRPGPDSSVTWHA